MRRTRQLPGYEVTIARRYAVLGEPVVLETNDALFIEAAEASLGRFDPAAGSTPLRLRLFAVEAPLEASAEWRTDYQTDGTMYTVRTPDSVAVADLRRGEAVAFVGPRMRSEPRIVRRELVEGLTLAMATAARGYCPLHAAGVSRAGLGVGLVGPSGAGKSTLTMAAARRGFDVFAEDAIYARFSGQGLEFWGMPWIQRLLPDAMALFPELEGTLPRLQPNGEAKIEIDLDQRFAGRATPHVQPVALVVLSRRPGATHLRPAQSGDGELEIQWAWGNASWSADHQLAADSIAQLPLYRLHMGGSPDEALDALGSLLENLAGVRLAS